jgi:hypothetical protein
MLAANVKAERGLAGEAYGSRAGTFIVGILATLEGVHLKAGEETPVVVDVPNMPPNANVQNITATLTVMDASGSAAQSTKVSVTEDKGNPRSFQMSVDDVPGIRNVQVRLNQGSVFWTHPGAAPVGSYRITDFSPQVNAYLEKLQSQNNKVSLQFMVKSDVDGFVRMQVGDDLKFSMLQTQSWQNPLDSTFRVDRTLKMTFNQVETLPIDPVTPPVGQHVVFTGLRFDEGGQFSTDRLLGPIETHDGHQFATVSPEFAVAQCVIFAKSVLKKAIQASGVAGCFQGPDKGDFYVELQNDLGGAPANDTPLAKSNVAFTPADKKDPQPWTFAKFEKPAELKPDTPYWIVARGVKGVVQLGLKKSAASPDPAAAVTRGALLLNRGGQIWKALAGSIAGQLEGLLSLVYVPQSDNQTAAIEVLVTGCPPLQVDPQKTAKTIAVPLPKSWAGPPTLTVDSRGLGSLTIANVIQEYSFAKDLP